MKAWRTPGAQATFLQTIPRSEQHRLPQRLGRLARDHHVRIKAGPSFLFQRMMIRVGLMQGG